MLNSSKKLRSITISVFIVFLSIIISTNIFTKKILEVADQGYTFNGFEADEIIESISNDENLLKERYAAYKEVKKQVDSGDVKLEENDLKVLKDFQSNEKSWRRKVSISNTLITLKSILYWLLLINLSYSLSELLSLSDILDYTRTTIVASLLLLVISIGINNIIYNSTTDRVRRFYNDTTEEAIVDSSVFEIKSAIEEVNKK